MLNIQWIREEPDAFDAAMQRRGNAARASELLAIDSEIRGAKTQLQELQAARNAKSKEIGIAKSKGEDAQPIMDAVAAMKTEMAALEDKLATTSIDEQLMSLPNLLDAEVPDGADESDNQELRQWGTPRSFDFTPKQHFELGEALEEMDFETAAKISGSRFVLLSGKLARLERALAQFMLNLHVNEHGYTEVSPPLLVRENAMRGTGQLPKFGEDAFRTIDDYWLIPTSEVSLTNIVADSILEESYLPRRYVAFTPCFRSEAGSAGKDTRGMIRLHQFSKVELVSVTHPDFSAEEHERMTGCAKEVLKRLELPYRAMLLCSGDTGFGARKTYDLEVWLPGQNSYREISSCSNTGEFQARRMKARYRPHGQEKGAEFVHTLNGSGVAVGRALVAVLENYQNADGSITVPDVLRPYMGGVETINP
ncbi:MAG: serine--tRNA ligase [Rickettsiales bacterium]|nr:serine--tRNA ligase [Rickettsiales bacterium]